MALRSDQDAGVSGGGFAFVGRRRELDLLLSTLRHAPAVILVEGEAGIGKSRLVHEATAVVSSAGGRVLTGVCHPLREPFPFGPVIDALGRAGPWLPPAIEIPPTAGALTPVLPDLRSQLPPPPPRPWDPQARKHQLVQAVITVLAAIGPAVLVVEDLHWADEATRELLLLLARDLPHQLSLLLTYRDEDLDTPVLGSTYRRPPGTSGADIRLAPLAEADVQELAVAALGPLATRALGHALFERSAGLPLVAEEDLITLLEHGRHAEPAATRDYVAELERAEVPRGLREAVTERLANLSPSGAAIVEAAAVLAVPATEPLLTEVAGLNAEQGVLGLSEALHACVLHESGSTHYAFRHVLARQVAYQHILGPRRNRLHRQTLTILQAQSPAPLVQIAHHTLALGDQQGWLHHAEAAADQAIALGDGGTAAALLRQILAQQHLEGDLRARAAVALARIAVNGVDYAASASLLRRILSDSQLPMTTRGEIRLTLGTLMVHHAGDRAGFQELQKAVGELVGKPEAAGRAMAVLATNEQNGASDRAEEWMERAETTLRDSCDAAARAALRVSRLTLMARDGDPAVWRAMDGLPRRADDPAVLVQTMRALFNVGELAIELGHSERATVMLEESRALAQLLRSQRAECYSRIALLRLEGLAGHWADLAERFSTLAAEFPDIAMAAGERAMNVGLLAAARGQLSQALAQFKAAAAYGERESQVTSAVRAAAGLAAVGLAEGSPEAAWATAAPALDALRRASAWARSNGLVATAVDAALASGRREAAERLADAAEQGLQGRDAPAATAELHVAHGLLNLDSHPAAAAEHFDRARQMWLDIGRPYDAARAAEQYARALIGNQPQEAASVLSHAVAILDGLEATCDAARCRHALRELGMANPSRRGRRGYGDQLSPREQEVTRLLAQGATNQDIAQALFLSPRTVEHHVARALKKLGVSREDVRTGLIARAL